VSAPGSVLTRCLDSSNVARRWMAVCVLRSAYGGACTVRCYGTSPAAAKANMARHHQGAHPRIAPGQLMLGDTA
jgi:hypothetical protein